MVCYRTLPSRSCSVPRGKLCLAASALLTSTFRFEGAGCCIEGAAVAGRACSSASNIWYGYAPSNALPDASGGCVKDGQSPVAMAASSFWHKREIIAVVLPHSRPWAGPWQRHVGPRPLRLHSQCPAHLHSRQSRTLQAPQRARRLAYTQAAASSTAPAATATSACACCLRCSVLCAP